VAVIAGKENAILEKDTRTIVVHGLNNWEVGDRRGRKDAAGSGGADRG
jgi:hypothetical protein